MASQGLFAIGGISSGLDTHEIIEELLKVERQPLVRIEQQRARLDTTRDAWGQLTTKLSSLRAALDRLARPDQLTTRTTATSSAPDAVKVTVTGNPPEQQLRFDVVSLARVHQIASQEAFTGSDAALDGRTLTIIVDGVHHDLTAALDPSATLGDLVDAINAANIGVVAHTLQVSPGEHELVLASAATGSAQTFTVDSTGWNSNLEVTQPGADAVITVGGITVTRSSNTLDDLVDGLTIELVDYPPTSVTVRTAQDVQKAVDDIKNFVTALNGMLATVADLTAYDPETKVSGPLQGQQAATRLAFSLRDALTQPVATGGALTHASNLGISLNRDGLIDLDETTLASTLEHDITAAARLLARYGSADHSDATFLNATVVTKSGSYEVVIDQPALRAQRISDATWQTPSGSVGIEIVRHNGATVMLEVDETMTTVDDAVYALNAQLAAAGVVNLVAERDDAGHLILREERFGSAFGFTVTEIDANGDAVGAPVLGLNATVAGTDIAGSIDGIAGSGNGATLRAIEGDANGLSVRYVGEIDTFTTTYERGIIGNVAAVAAAAEGAHGVIAQAQASLDSQRRLATSRIEAFERQLEHREVTLRRQFVALETALSRLQDQGTWLQQQLAGLQPQRGR